MTELQERLLNLTDEIKDICEKENLKYIVAGSTAAFLLNHKKYMAEECFFNMMMPLEDIVKFEEYVNKNLSETRAIESWRNNPDLQMLKFRYVDKTTLFFDGGSAERHICHGVHVNIFPTRKFEPSNEVRGIERYVQLVNYNQGDFARKIVFYKLITRVTHLNRFKSHIMRKVKLDNANYIHSGYMKRKKMTKQEMVDLVISENLKATKPYTSDRFIPEEKKQDDVKENCLAFMNDISRVVKFPLDLYDNVQQLEFEGRKFNFYKNPETYFSTMYKGDWTAKLTEEQNGADRSTVIYDVDTPYEEYLDYIKDEKVTLADIADNKLKYNYWMGQVHNPAVNKTWHTFMKVRRSVERIDIWYRLRNKREELKKAYDSRDLPKLKKLLKGYLNATEKYRAEKIGFYIDKELFKYAKLIWTEENYPNKTDEEGNLLSYPEYIYSLVPDLYKTETPEDYFNKRGKKFD